jgi:hypothetical protein
MLKEREVYWICTCQTPSANMVSLPKANDPVSSVFFRISTALINSLQEKAAFFSSQFIKYKY